MKRIKLNLFSIRYFYIVYPLIAVFFLLASYKNYNEVLKTSHGNLDKSIELTGTNLMSRIRTIDKVYYLLEKQIEAEMINILSSISEEYSEENILKKDYKKYLKDPNFSDLYIINSDNQIIYSTDPREVGLDFSNFEILSGYLNSIRKDNIFYSDRVNISTLTKELKKYGYLPSVDNKYIFELGYKMNKFENFLNLDSFENFSQTIENLDPNIIEVNFITLQGAVFNKNINLAQFADKKRYKTHRKALKTNLKKTFSVEKNKEKITYLYYPYQLNGNKDNSLKLTIEIIYSNSLILKEQRKKLLEEIQITVFFIFFLLSLHWYYSYNFINPLQKVLAGIEQVRDKNFSTRINVKVNNEVKIMADHFNEMVLSVQNLLNEKENANIKIEHALKDNEEAYLETVRALANSIDAKDQYTGGHCERVTDLSLLLADYLELSKKTKNELRFASLLHDIGKIGIEDSILNKAGSFTDKEYDIIKTHPVIGYDIIKDIPFLINVKDIILSHHERIDGQGYPNRLHNNQIPYLAKILSITDSFDAMTSKRIYKTKIMNVQEAFEEMIKNSGSQFDTHLVESFIIAYTIKYGDNLSQDAKDIEHL